MQGVLSGQALAVVLAFPRLGTSGAGELAGLGDDRGRFADARNLEA
ncbi:hypothetical protein OG321_41745 [Streptomyces sp. NBC_00424]|nr:hypothetical protein [Streptomyces sp. NBC_00424]MCX5078927.1 hypothetical protein [Streptomyces sp. NBC_00424]